MSTEPSLRLEDDHEQQHISSLPTEFPKLLRRSQSSEARIMIKNRRKRYLDTHPEYFSSPTLELADPLAYDRLVRRFQTPNEREAEGRKKGYSSTLEAALWRSEAKIDELANPELAASMRYSKDATGAIIGEDRDEVPMSKEEGLKRWRKEMELMYLKGADPEFDYKQVDGSEEYDDRTVQEREEEEKWFEQEEPSWFQESGERAGRIGCLTGQTGVQDF